MGLGDMRQRQTKTLMTPQTMAHFAGQHKSLSNQLFRHYRQHLLLRRPHLHVLEISTVSATIETVSPDHHRYDD
jgi:hypothetical protein